MPDVASQSKIASSHAHARVSSSAPRVSGGQDDRSSSPFSDMLDSATTAQDTPPETADLSARKTNQSSKNDKPDQSRSRDDKDTAQNTDDVKAKDTDAAQPADGAKANDATSAADAKGDGKAAIDAALGNAATDEATDPKDTKDAKDIDAVVAVPAPVVVKPVALAAAITAPAPVISDATGDTADAGALAAIAGQDTKAAPKTVPKPTLPQGAQADTQNSADSATEATAAAPKADAKPQFIVKTDDKPAPAATDAQPARANPATEANLADPAANLATPAQSTDAPQTTVTTPAHQTVQAPTAATAATPAANTAATATAVPLHAVAVEIATRAIGGKQRFEIRLDPADLGKIDVRLDIDKHGQVTSRLIVEKAETLDLLRRDAPQLERALQDAGLKTSGNGLQFSLQQHTAQQQDNTNNGGTLQNSAQLTITDETLAPDIVQRGYTQLAAARGGVDIRV